MFGAVIKSLFSDRLLFNGEDRLGSKEDLVTCSEIALVLVRFNDVARVIMNANRRIG